MLGYHGWLVSAKSSPDATHCKSFRRNTIEPMMSGSTTLALPAVQHDLFCHLYAHLYIVHQPLTAPGPLYALRTSAPVRHQSPSPSRKHRPTAPRSTPIPCVRRATSGSRASMDLGHHVLRIHRQHCRPLRDQTMLSSSHVQPTSTRPRAHRHTSAHAHCLLPTSPPSPRTAPSRGPSRW
jgi:hypothetical protein